MGFFEKKAPVLGAAVLERSHGLSPVPPDMAVHEHYECSHWCAPRASSSRQERHICQRCRPDLRKGLLPRDEDAIGILGGSHGGRLTLEALTHIRPQAAVPCAGFFSLEGLVRHIQGQGNAAMMSPLADGTPRPGASFFKFMIRLLGGTPDEVPEAYERYNLLRRIDKIQTPLFVVHGQKDMLSPIESSHQLVAELKKLGKSVKTYYPENGPHGFYWGQSFQPGPEPIYDPRETEIFLKRTLEFFRDHLR